MHLKKTGNKHMGQTGSTDLLTSRSAGVLNIIPEDVWKRQVKLQNTQVNTNPVQYSVTLDEDGRIREDIENSVPSKKEFDGDSIQSKYHVTRKPKKLPVIYDIPPIYPPNREATTNETPNTELDQIHENSSEIKETNKKKRIEQKKTGNHPPELDTSIHQTKSLDSIHSLKPSRIQLENMQKPSFLPNQDVLNAPPNPSQEEEDHTAMHGRSLSDSVVRPMTPPRKLPAVIIDFGTQTTKVGFSGEDRPRTVIPSCYDRDQNNTIRFGGDLSLKNSVWFFKDGKFAFERQDQTKEIFIAYLKYIGNILLELKHCFRGRNVMIGLPYCFGEDREQFSILCECFFNRKIRARSLFLCGTPLFSFLGAVANRVTENRTTGLSITVGHGLTQVVPIIEGCPYAAVGDYSFIGGGIQGEYLVELIKKEVEREGVSIDETMITYHSVESEKRNNCTLLKSFRFNKKRPNECKSKFFKKTMDPVIGPIEKVLDHRALCPEVLFHPTLFIKERVDSTSTADGDRKKVQGVVALIESCLRKCPKEFHDQLLENIVVSGGPAQIRNFAERIKFQLKKKQCNVYINPLSDLKPCPPSDFSAWFGMSFLSSVIDIESRELDGLHCRVLEEETRMEHYTIDEVLQCKKIC